MRWPFRRQPVEPRERTWAMKQIMDSAKSDIERGAQSSVVVKWKTANPAKVQIGWFRRRMLRGEFRRRS